MKRLKNFSKAATDTINSALTALDRGTIGSEIEIEVLNPHTKIETEFQLSGQHCGSQFTLDCSNFPLQNDHVLPLTGGRSLDQIDPHIAGLVVKLWLEQNQGEVEDLVIDSVNFGSSISQEQQYSVRIPFRVKSDHWTMLACISCDESLNLASLVENFVASPVPELPVDLKVELRIEVDTVNVDSEQFSDIQIGDVVVLSKVVESSPSLQKQDAASEPEKPAAEQQ